MRAPPWLVPPGKSPTGKSITDKFPHKTFFQISNRIKIGSVFYDKHMKSKGWLFGR